MSSHLIVMLTYNDVTVKNALDVFEQSKDLPIDFWGFKDIGLGKEQMKFLVRQMKAAGKTTFLEVVHYEEEECIEAANLAVECGIEYLTGTICFDSIIDLVKHEDIKYFPFFGNIYGHPVTLGGELDKIVDHGKELKDKGVDGLDLVAYRYEKGERISELIERCAKEIGIPIILAGSIDNWEKIENANQSGIWAFTIGSAFFDKKFARNQSFKDQLIAVNHKLQNKVKS